MPDLPYCVLCRVRIQPGMNIVFRVDGRLHHVECPPVTCAECGRPIAPETPIRRDGDHLLHDICWVRGYRAPQKSPRQVAR